MRPAPGFLGARRRAGGTLYDGRDDTFNASETGTNFAVAARRQFDDKRASNRRATKRKSYSVNAPVTKIDGVLGAANAL